ncbi:MAG: hypothetical protein Q7R31_00140 [Candidatus Levybacteria bacterium]|nr:hypothetical protein [Candidatus Levybacteria bacterium]
MSMNYERVSRGLSKAEAERYGTGIGLVKAFVNSLRDKNLLPKEFVFVKTPGDIKREELAQELGPGWKFFNNYSFIEDGGGRYGKKGTEGVIAGIEKAKQAGLIEDWRSMQRAFSDDGRELSISEGRAVYTKLKTPVK